MTLRYGIIGSGMMGQEHIRFLNLLEGVEVVAIADPDESMRTASIALSGGGARGYSDYRDLLSAGNVDALIIASPNDTHHAILCDALHAPAPILCEKPLCTTSAQCRDVIKRAEGRTAPIWVAMEYRYMPPIERLLSEVRGGRAGTPRMMAIREHRYPFLAKVGDWNRFNSRTGGTLVEKCCHFWDLMRLTLNSDPIRVYASAGMDVNHLDERYTDGVPDIIDNAYVVVDFEGGARGMLDLCMFAEASYWQEVVSVTGAKARVDACVPGPIRFNANDSERHARIVISERKTQRVLTEDVIVDREILEAGDHHGSTYFQHMKFRDLVASGAGAAAVSLKDGCWSVLVGEAAEQSARTGQAIDLRT